MTHIFTDAPSSHLPPELLLLIAHHLVPALSHSRAFEVVHDTTSAKSSQQQCRNSYIALLHLSSLSSGQRRLLAPLIWQEVIIHRPDRLGKLRSIMEYYQRLASSMSEIDRLLYPLPLVRYLKVVLPDQYLSLDQEILRHLIRSGMNPANGLHTLEWDAEVLPSPMIWRMLGAAEKPPELEAMLAERKSRTLNRDQIREIALDASGHTTAMFPTGNGIDAAMDHRLSSLAITTPGNLHQSRSIRSAIIDQEQGWTAPPKHPPGLEALSLHCRIFYSGSIDMSRLRSLRHLRLTSYDSHLLPPHLPSLLLSLYTPLVSMSMGTSKTTLLHDVDLIERGVFDELQDLDVFAVTPEYPLSIGLRRAGRKLKRLRLILDISSKFDNFDRLFRDLTGEDEVACRDGDTIEDGKGVKLATGAFPELVFLFVEPLPQENTAPSFPRFLDTCPKLRFLNGRRMDGIARPGNGEVFNFDPDHRSGALFY